MKQFCALFLILASLHWCGATAQVARECSYKSITEILGVAKIGERTITLIGWAHLYDDEIAQIKASVHRATEHAKNGDCPQVRAEIAATLTTLASDVTNKDYVLTMLTATNSDAPLSSIGVELTPGELEESFDRIRTSEQRIQSLINKCGDNDQLQSLKEMIIGPEATFANRKRLQLLALENAQAKAANAKAIDQRRPFNDKDPRIQESHAIALKALFENQFRGIDSGDSELDRAVSFGHSEEERALLKDQLKQTLRVWREVATGAARRNIFIAMNLVKAEGNIAVPIGYNHVRDLAEQIVQQCKELK